MTNSKQRPVLFFLCLLAPQVLIAAIIFWGGSNPHDYLLAMRDKHKKAKSITERKIILIGGSSVGFGSNSEIFAEECGMPCVNLGINAGQGLDFRFNEGGHCTQVGDVIVLTLEYYELGEKPVSGVLAATIANCPECAQFMSWREWRSFLDEGIFELMAVRTRTSVMCLSGKDVTDEIYDIRNFDENGDFVAHHGKDAESTKWGVEVPEDATESMLALAKFLKAANEVGVTVFYRLPCIPEESVEDKMTELREIETRLKRVFGNRLLNELDETLMEKDVFFDTAYHLKEPEKNRQSKIIASRLSERLSAMADPAKQ